MTRRRSGMPLLLSLLASILAHIVTLGPMVAVLAMPAAAPGTMRGQFERETLRPPPPPEPEDEIKLGIEDGSPSTVAWIGHREYEEHLATLADVEQAAFTNEPEPPPLPPGVPQPSASVPPDPIPDPAEETTEAETPDDPAPEEIPPVRPAPPENTAVVNELLELLAIQPGPPAPVTPEEPQPAKPTEDPPVETEKPAPKPTKPPAKPTEKPPQETKPKTPPQEPDKPGAPTEPSKPGEAAERESDATSIVEVPREQLHPGKPLAAAGLELRPQRPKFTNFMLVTAAPGNPVVEIRFQKNGKPKRARILKSSGDRRIDEAIENSLYRWRARGKPLRELEAGKTIPVQLKIILNKRRP